VIDEWAFMKYPSGEYIDLCHLHENEYHSLVHDSHCGACDEKPSKIFRMQLDLLDDRYKEDMCAVYTIDGKKVREYFVVKIKI